MIRMHQLVVSAIIAGMSIGAMSSAPLRAAEQETVMVTLHAKPGAETELANVLARHWETAKRLNLVMPATHVTLRGVESENKTYFVEIFTWRDADIPDHAPADIQAVWKEMNALVEKRDGQPGLRFTEVTVVTS